MRRHIALAPTPSPSPSPWPSRQYSFSDSQSAAPTPSAVVQPLFFHPTTTEPSSTSTSLSSTSSASPAPPSKFPIQFSPPLIAMVIIIATAFFIITYSRLISRYFLQFHRRYLRWNSRRHDYIPPSSTSTSNFGSPTFPFDFNSTGFHVYSPGGLGDSAIKAIPLSIYNRKSSSHNCTICLLEFKENDEVRTLPICTHNFHVECVDKWLRSHVNCPLCRSSILRPESPFIPVMSTRIRPNLDDLIIQSPVLELSTTNNTPKSDTPNNGEITHEPQVQIPEDDRANNGEIRDFLLKRSYSFGFERNLGSERLTVEPVTASPWQYRRGMGNFWNKRSSPFNALMKPRVFSFRSSYRGGGGGGISMKSPFFRRRGDSRVGSGFFPLSESSTRFDGSTSAGGGSYRSIASPMFMRSSAAATAAATPGYTSSRLRSGDPEALLSPDRYSKRRMSR